MSSAIPVKIKLFDPTLPLPAYQTNQAAGFDLYSRLDMEIPAQQIAYVPLNLAFEFSAHYWLLLAARSSLHKKGLQLVNGIGVGDADFCGNTDEYQAILCNFTPQTVKISRGERLVQGILIPATQAKFTAVAQLKNPSRGGIGSTG